jgi:hypothetical protein
MNYRALIGLMARAPGGGGGYDPDAEPYIDALGLLGIVDSTLNDAWNSFVVDAKADGYWADLDVVYPFGGGTAAAHAINAKNPGTNDITWNGTVTHNTNGITGNGSTGYGSTGFALTSLDVNDCHLSVYSRTSGDLNAFEIGATGSVGISAFQLGCRSFGGDIYADLGSGANRSVINADGQGMYLVTRRGTNDFEVYKSGSSVISYTSAMTGSTVNVPITILARNSNGSIVNHSSRNLGWASIGFAFTDAKAADYYAAIQAFQTALGRDV